MVYDINIKVDFCNNNKKTNVDNTATRNNTVKNGVWMVKLLKEKERNVLTSAV